MTWHQKLILHTPTSARSRQEHPAQAHGEKVRIPAQVCSNIAHAAQQCSSQRLPDLLGATRKNGGIGHLAGMRLQRHALVSRHDVIVEMEHHLPTR